eukprot:1163391-Prorocentrum_minimum.AAC.2
MDSRVRNLQTGSAGLFGLPEAPGGPPPGWAPQWAGPKRMRARKTFEAAPPRACNRILIEF